MSEELISAVNEKARKARTQEQADAEAQEAYYREWLAQEAIKRKLKQRRADVAFALRAVFSLGLFALLTIMVNLNLMARSLAVVVMLFWSAYFLFFSGAWWHHRFKRGGWWNGSIE